MKNLRYLFILILLFINATISYSQTIGNFTDSRDNHVYKWIKLGEQIWMAENLAYKANGRCWAYNNDEKNIKSYGYLYDWNTALVSCPDGWHMPVDQEWEKLAVFVSTKYESCSKKDEDWINVGDFLKSDIGWNFDGNGNNLIGMNCLPGGWRNYLGESKSKEESCSFWSGTLNNETSAWKRGLSYRDTDFRKSYSLLSTGFSVRCIKD